MPRDDRDDRDDHDDDDRPRRRRPREDDDDDEPRGNGGGGSKTLVIVLVVVLGGTLALGLLACVGVFGLLVPSANAKVQAAADRAKSQNNMKQMSLGMHAQADVTGTLQGPLAAGATGSHSFRVGLLPYVEQNSLYRQIDLTQAWDSAKNAPATGTTVPEYLDLTNPASVGTATPYRMLVGPGAVFDGTAKMPRFQDVTDGTSSTILYVAATQTVPWAKPQELPYGPGVALPPLGNPQADGFLVAMADGSVRYLKRTISDADLRALITKAGGEVVAVP